MTAAKCRALLFAARALNAAATRAYAATARDRRRWEVRRAEAERVVASGEALMAEYVNSPAMLAYLKREFLLAGQVVPDRLRWESGLWAKLRDEAGEAIAAADPKAASRAVDSVLVLARLASREG